MEEDVGRVVVRTQGYGRLTACRDVVPGSRRGKCEDEGEECEDQGEDVRGWKVVRSMGRLPLRRRHSLCACLWGLCDGLTVALTPLVPPSCVNPLLCSCLPPGVLSCCFPVARRPCQGLIPTLGALAARRERAFS